MAKSKLEPGMVVTRFGRSIHGVVTSVDEDGLYSVFWAAGEQGDAKFTSGALERAGQHTELRAGACWEDFRVDEIDHDAGLMKVRVFNDAPAPWIDIALYGLDAAFVRKAARMREDWLAAGRKKLDWFKPGQIVTGDGALARPATVIEQVSESEVKVITSNGIATVPFSALQLRALSVQDLQAKEAQKHEGFMSAFKDEVRAKALEAKEEHALCDEVDTFLKELGIKIPVSKVRAVLHLTVEVDAVVASGNGMQRLDLDRGNNRGWWASTLRFEDDGKDLNFKDDDDIDMEQVEVRLIETKVVEIHDESYLED